MSFHLTTSSRLISHPRFKLRLPPPDPALVFQRVTFPFLVRPCSRQSGAVIWSKGNLLILDGNFTRNHSPENGGVLFASEGSNFTLAGGFFQENEAQDGGVLNAIEGSIVHVEGGVYSGNVALSDGGVFSLLDGANIQVRERRVFLYGCIHVWATTG